MTKTLKSLSLATSIAVSAGFAANAMAVSGAMNGQGDLHFVPASVMNGGWETEVSLINSSTTMSTVTKAVVRSQVNSMECLDFMVYLSPGDRFVGTLMESSSLPEGAADPGTTYAFYSTDDSVRNLDGNPASMDAPAVYPVQDTSDGGCGISYVEFIQSAAFSLGNAVVSKSDIIAAHGSVSGSNAGNEPVNTTSGSYTLMNGINGVKMSDTMEGYMDYDNARYLSTSQNTLLGQESGATIDMLETAMAKQNLKVPYEHDDSGEMTIATVTFPTKMSHDTTNTNSDYEPLTGDGIVGIATEIRNMSEVVMACAATGGGSDIISPVTPDGVCAAVGESLPVEVNLIVVEDKINSIASAATVTGGGVVNTSDFMKGWANINLEDDADDTYNGAPAVTNVIQFSTNPNGGLNGTVKRAAHD